MKKEISDHLAKAFFETNVSQVKQRDKNFVFYLAVSVALVVVLVFSTTILANLSSGRLSVGGEAVRLARHDGPYTLKFDFSDSVSNTATLDLEISDADLNRFTKLGFFVRLREADVNRAGTLKVSLVNKRRETSSQYISGINSSWKKFVIPLAGTDKKIDLAGPIVLSFTLEPWNTFIKRGELLIDDIQFIKN